MKTWPVPLSLVIASTMASAQVASRVPARIDWAQAQQAQRLAEQNGSLQRSRSAVPRSELDQVALPVLVPSSEAVRAAPSLRHQSISYAATFRLNGAKLSVVGSNSSISSDASEFNPPIPASPPEYAFERSEDGADLSFMRYGANYTLRISCTRQDDERCTESDYLISLAKSLIPIGGRPQ